MMLLAYPVAAWVEEVGTEPVGQQLRLLLLVVVVMVALAGVEEAR